jgi:phytoene dehydrogenase-like protein
MKDADVIIVGAGLTGLRAAAEAVRSGLSVIVLERADDIGGRVRTSTYRGYRLDHGFQVVLSAYPEVRHIPEIPCGQWRSFASGARVRFQGEFIDFLDPRRYPAAILRTLRCPFVSIMDIVRLFCLTCTTSASEPTPRGYSTAEMVASHGFSEKFQRGFLRPFLKGVMLDPHLKADAGTTRFYLKAFASGDAVLPPTGIQGLPDHLALLIGRSHIHCNSPVSKITRNQVVLETGLSYSCDQVVCATDALSAAALGSPEQTMPHLGTSTLYFGAKSPPFRDPILVLNADGGPITNLSIPSNVQHLYAPAGRSLISVSVVGEDALLSEPILLEKVQRQLRDWFGPQVNEWEFLRRFTIRDALPARPRLGTGWCEKEGVIYAGDYLSYPSQNGALAAGRRVGEALVAAFY